MNDHDFFSKFIFTVLSATFLENVPGLKEIIYFKKATLMNVIQFQFSLMLQKSTLNPLKLYHQNKDRILYLCIHFSKTTIKVTIQSGSHTVYNKIAKQNARRMDKPIQIYDKYTNHTGR